MIDILFKFPTRARPEIFKKTFDMWRSALSGRHECKFLVECDIDDSAMQISSLPMSIIHFGNSKTKIEAVNANIPLEGWKVLWLLSDDVRPIAKDVDEIIMRDMARWFPDTDGILHYSDQTHGKQNLLTVPIIGNKYFQRDRYIYNPAYESLWCDNHQMDVAIARRCHKYLPTRVFQHGWIDVTGKDPLSKKNGEPYERDKKRYLDFKAAGFPELVSKDDSRPSEGCVLSICICTIANRKELLGELLQSLKLQVDASGGRAEILIDDREPPVSIGTKRQALLHKANGKYVVSVDDDDVVADDYVARILDAVKTDPDAVGLTGELHRDGRLDRPFIANFEQTKWANEPGLYRRTINHICPVRRTIALRAGFPNKSFGEDSDYSNGIRPLIKTAAFIDTGPMYFYHVRSNVSTTVNPENNKRPIVNPVQMRIDQAKRRMGPRFNPKNVIR